MTTFRGGAARRGPNANGKTSNRMAAIAKAKQQRVIRGDCLIRRTERRVHLAILGHTIFLRSSPKESGRGLPHSKTLPRASAPWDFRQALKRPPTALALRLRTGAGQQDAALTGRQEACRSPRRTKGEDLTQFADDSTTTPASARRGQPGQASARSRRSPGEGEWQQPWHICRT